MEKIVWEKSCCILTFTGQLAKSLCWLEFLISWCYRLLHPMDKWIGRNILKEERQSEKNNPEHWKAKHVLPFQRWEVAPLDAFLQIWFTSSGVPKVLNEEPAHTNSFIVFCNGFASGFKAHAYEPGSLTRESRGTGQGQGHNTMTVPPTKVVALPTKPQTPPSTWMWSWV